MQFCVHIQLFLYYVSTQEIAGQQKCATTNAYQTTVNAFVLSVVDTRLTLPVEDLLLQISQSV